MRLAGVRVAVHRPFRQIEQQALIRLAQLLAALTQERDVVARAIRTTYG
jgi:hypothetical protein